MKTKNVPPYVLMDLRAIDEKAATLRKEYGISGKGEVLWLSDLVGCDGQLVCEADSYGRAIVSQIEGNYPVDYFTENVRTFETEEEAISKINCYTDDGIFGELFGYDKGE